MVSSMRRAGPLVVAGLLSAGALLASAHAQPAPPVPVPPARFAIERAASPIKVDGLLDEPAWAGAIVIPIADRVGARVTTSRPR